MSKKPPQPIQPETPINDFLGDIFPGGFMLFGITEDGEIVTVGDPGDMVSHLGLEAFILKWAQIRDRMSNEMIAEDACDCELFQKAGRYKNNND